tara:strand:+ start:146 stop:529 length:384 start_codon:yes stop_codon:yes gene_type:complete
VGVNVVGAFFGYGFGPANIYVNQLEQRGAKKMKTFADIPFKETKMPKGIQAVLKFGDKYELSIVKSDFSYGGNNGYYEIAVFKGDDQVILPGITEDHDTVKGWLSQNDVIGIVKKMHLITGADPEVK